MRFLVSFLLGSTLSGLLGLGILIGGGTGILCLGDFLCTRVNRLDIPTQIRLSWQDDPARTLSITRQTRGKDTAHHYALITREASGDLNYKAYRLDPAGRQPSELDRFRIRQRPNLIATGTPRGPNKEIH